MFDDNRPMFVPIQRTLLSPVGRFCKYLQWPLVRPNWDRVSRPAHFDASKSLGKWSSVLDGVQ
jgi:hypothetical protein